MLFGTPLLALYRADDAEQALNGQLLAAADAGMACSFEQVDEAIVAQFWARALARSFRSIALAWYFTLPPTPATTLLFGAIMGFLWMGVGPLVAGAVAEMFGLKWQAMIQGLAFMSHQLGSFLGAYGGGLIYDSLGSYTMAWRVGVALGLAGGIIQVAFALIRPSQPPQIQTA